MIPFRPSLPLSFGLTLLLLCLMLPDRVAFSQAQPSLKRTITLDAPLTHKEGTVMFLLHVDESFEAGFDEAFKEIRGKRLILLRFPGLGEFFLEIMPDSIGPWWIWTEGEARPHCLMRFPDLPGPDTYHITFTWKAETGLMHLYVNGIPTHEPQALMEPWKNDAQAGEYQLVQEEMRFMRKGGTQTVPAGPTPYTVSQVQVLQQSLEAFEVMAHCPAKLLGRHNELALGYDRDAKPLPLKGRLKEPIYENALSSPEDLQGWVMEGPGRMAFKEGWLVRDTDPTKPLNHQVLWCPEIFPPSFVAEWDIQILSPNGLCITFFCATGLEGQSVLDPVLPKRDGTFGLYTHDALKNYHVSYYSNTPSEPGRLTSNLRKNPGGLMAAFGPIGISSQDFSPHRVRLIKDGPHIQMQVDDRVILDHMDSPAKSQGGEIYGAGQIGFRQMHWTKARYRNFKVWELPESP